jgi:hypothetical protein
MNLSNRAERVLKHMLLCVVAVLGLGLAAHPCLASYSFQFTTYDYAMEAAQGAVITFTTYIQNTGTSADTIRLSITANKPAAWYVDFCFDGKCFGTGVIAKMGLAPGQTDSIVVDFFTDMTQAMGLVTLTGTMKSAPGVSHSETYAAWTELPSILLVDDDDDNNYQTYLANALTAAGYPARVWDVFALGQPSLVQLNSYWMVFWTTAANDASTVASVNDANLAAFLDGGGQLFLASMGFLTSRGGPDNFTTNYLHLSSWTNDTGGTPATGVPGDAISDGMSLDLSAGPLPTGGSDTMVLNAGVDPIFNFTNGVKGIKANENGHQVVFLSFPFENISTSAGNPNNQNTLIARVMAWFSPPVAGIRGPGAPPNGLVLMQNSPNPFGGSTTISFRVPGGSRDAHVAIYNVNGQVVKSLVSGPVGSSPTSVVWDARDARGASVAPGVYFCELSAGSSRVLKKMVVAKY